MVPIILIKPMRLIEDNCKEVEVIDLADEIEHDNMPYRVLVSKITSKMMFKHQDINDGTFVFSKCMAMFVDSIVRDMFSIDTTTKTTFNSKGEMVVVTHETISSTTPEPEFNKMLFKEFDEPQTTVTLKGSNIVVDNNSEEYLNLLASEKFRVKEVEPDMVRLYALMKYSENKNNVSESKSEYLIRMMKLAEETILYLGHEYSNTRKLDASCRDYSINRFGFATEYGDAFEKNLIEPAQQYLVNDSDITEAKKFLCEEFKVKSWRKLFEKANKAIEKNLRIAIAYKAGRNVEFSMRAKDLGKYLWIQEIVNNVIYAKGQISSTLISSDLTNSGAIMTAYQFGDEKYMRVANLLGGEKIDTHVLVAEYFGISRDEAKSVFVGPNHGSRVTGELIGARDEIFSPRYGYIRKIAEYGIGLAMNNVSSVKLTAPDGLISTWYPYSRGTRVNLENGRYVEMTTPFTVGLDGDPKVSGLYARMVHSCDSYVLRTIKRELAKHDVTIKTTLDCYYIRPSMKPLLSKMIWKALRNLDGWFENQLKLIENNTGISREWTLPERELDVIESENIV